MDDDTRFGELRSRLQGPPSFERWHKLCDHIDRWPKDTLEDQALPYALSILSRWPASLSALIEPISLIRDLGGFDDLADRVAPDHWVRAASRGKHTPKLLLANAINLTAASLKDSQLHTLAQAHDLDHIKSIHTDHYDHQTQTLIKLLNNPRLTQLEALTMRESELGSEDIRALVIGSERFTQLIRLSLCEANIGPEGLDALLEPGLTFERLESLQLQNNQLTPESICKLATSGALPALRELNLLNNQVHDQGLCALADHFELTMLNLDNARIGDLGAIALAQSPRSEHLRRLDLTHNQIGDQGVEAITHSPYLRHLELLILDSNPVSADGVTALILSPNTSALRVLSLRHQKLTPAHIKQLAQRAHPLHALDLSWNWCGDEGLQALCDSPLLQHLRELRLDSCQLSDQGVQALASSPYTQNLRKLDLIGNQISAQGAQALARSPYLHEDLREQWSRYL